MRTDSQTITPSLTARPAPSREQELRTQTQKWVGQAFFGTMLKQMRDSPFKSDLFSGGRGGEAFTSMLDQHLAERMSRGAGRSLVDSIVSRLSRQSGSSATPQADGVVNPLTMTANPASRAALNEDVQHKVQSWRNRVAPAR